MIRILLSGATALLILSSLVSCAPRLGTTGETIAYPTIDEMAAKERSWGMEPRRVKQRLRPVRPGDELSEEPVSQNTRSTPPPAPAPTASSPPAMLAPTPEPIEATPPADRSTIEKLQ